MPMTQPSSIQTRASLLRSLASAGDETESWKEFFRVYGKLIHDFALRAGLNEDEAEEVVQDTTIAVWRHLPNFRYDRKICRFKTWLLNQSSWRIKDHFKKRLRREKWTLSPDGQIQTATPEASALLSLEAVPSSDATLNHLFEREWREHLLGIALDRLRRRFTLKQFQIFDLNVVQEWPAAEVAKSLGVNLASVYVAKHRIATALRKEIAAIEREVLAGGIRQREQVK